MTLLIELDVSALPPPEPLMKIITVLSTLTEQQVLKVNHRREPFPLYEKLETAGWGHACVQHSTDCYHIFIYRQSNRVLAQSYIEQDCP